LHPVARNVRLSRIFFSGHLVPVMTTYGYVLVGVMVGLESMGLPVPGETTLVTAAIYAGTTHGLNITGIVAAAIVGAVLGDNLGYAIGRRFGYQLLLRYGRVLRMPHRRIKLGQFLFNRHGGKVVFFGRFIALLRTLSALLAGVNCMPWRRFLFFNATGGVVWAMTFGVGAYVLGPRIEHVRGPLAICGMILGVCALVVFFWFVRRHEAALEADAERALPGPLPGPRPSLT
jgi:membrane protein DedA with SNARE-associated domain